MKKVLSLILAISVLGLIGIMPAVHAEELVGIVVDEKDLKPDGENGVIVEETLPDGDYTVTVTTGGKTETNANIFINGGERVRAFTLEAGKTQEDVQPAIPQDGKITVQVKGENPNVTGIKIEQIPNRTKEGEKTTIYIAGDSTAQTYDYTKAYPQTGWGQMLGDYFTDDVVIENRSMAGRSSKSYNNDGRLDKILTEMHPGDYVFIQFGINDGAENKPERYISVEDYKKLITEKYMGEVTKRGGIPVLMTASAAGWWDEEKGNFMESRQDYADPTRELAKETGCKFIDINRIMTDVWNTMDKDDVISGYFVCEPLESKAYPVGTNDTTHMKPKGAKRVAGMVAEAIKTDVPELAKYLKDKEVFTDIAGHWGETYIKALADKGMVDGVGDGKFNPDGTVTRAEFLKMAMDACGVVGHAYREGECLDATNDDWYCYYLQGALDKGLIPVPMVQDCAVTEKTTKILAEATEDKEAVTTEVFTYKEATVGHDSFVTTTSPKFNGNTPITREEMAAVLIYIVLRDNEEDIQSISDSIDSDPSIIISEKVSDSKIKIDNEVEYKFADQDQVTDERYISFISLAEEYGLIEGMDDNTFAPRATLTRAQAAVVINKLTDLIK